MSSLSFAERHINPRLLSAGLLNLEKMRQDLKSQTPEALGGTMNLYLWW